MAFIKTERKKSGTYLRLVESYRGEDGKPKHRTVATLGKAEDFSKKTLRRMGQIFLELSGEKYQVETKKSMKEITRYNYGFALVYDKLMKHYGLDDLLKNIGKRNNTSYDLYKQVLLMILDRLNDPSSKMSVYDHQEEYFGFSEMPLQHFYRALDYLNKNHKLIQEQIFRSHQHLFNQKLDVVFYDVTTFYFDSDKEDGFRNKGFGKDGKIGKTIIVFGMLIDKDKNPVGYTVYEGRFYEGHTFLDAIEKLKKEYEIEKVITVADRGMMNETNIRIVEEEAGYEYIVGERLKNLPKKIKEKILDRSNYKKLTIADETTGELIEIKYLEIEHKGKRLITTFSQTRASKDSYDRQERIRQGEKLLKSQNAIERKARRNYLKKSAKEGRYEIDEKKIENDARYDGFASIATNNRELPVEEILSQYRQLYKIEQTFRTFKSYLETRPMFHWTEGRIKGHLCLCYMSFAMLNYLGNLLKRKNVIMSENKIREALSKMQLSLIELEGEKYYLRSSMSERATQILRLLNLKKPPDFTKTSDISRYIPTI